MAKQVVITGQKQIIRNLQRVANRMKQNLRPAMVEVVSTIQRESMKRTPIDTGNLQAGHRSKVRGVARGIVGTVYTLATYALFVHEAPSTTKFKSAWPRGRKFLERAITDNVDEIVASIRKWLKR